MTYQASSGGGGSVKSYATVVGNGSSLTYTVTHNLGTENIIPSTWQTASPYELVVPTYSIVDTNNITVTFASAPAVGAYNVVVMG